MLIRIKGGHVIDPGNLDSVADIIVKDDRIVEIIKRSDAKRTTESHRDVPYDHDIDATGKIVVPGLIDMHVHLREPGHEYKETIETGCRAAVTGGFTAVCSMPNTSPVNDSSQVTEFIISKAKKAGLARVYPVAAISPGLQGKGLSEYGELKQAGAVAISDDGKPVVNSQLMRRAMEYAKRFNLLVISHCEDPELASDGAMNEGIVSTRLGLAGIPNAAESIMVMRDIAICELTKSSLHIAHVSTEESVNAIRKAKKRGIHVSAETAPHYFTLTDTAVLKYNTHAKMNPPLRGEKDRQAILEGLSDGTIDAIATDHAPHAVLEKKVEFDKALNGIVGLETSLSLSLDLVRQGVLSLSGLIEKMSKTPARLIGVRNDFVVGNTADITIIDKEASFTVNPDFFHSLGRNTPFAGWELKGKAMLTMVGGKIVHISS
ncbi:MAG: dihydroorotase [Proteobacteria bacterium]|nr:dihydroorotase [Pseudomonadota bacterium]